MTAQEFDQQLTDLKDRLMYFAMSLTSDRTAAEDLLQETYLKAITYRKMFVKETNLKAWLFTIMKNTFINNYRKAVRQKTTFDNTKDLYYLNSASHEKVEAVDSEYAVNEINKSINSLKDEFRIPFKMFTEGHKYKEIADELNLPIGTVKSRIYFARKQLMKKLKDYNDFAA